MTFSDAGSPSVLYPFNTKLVCPAGVKAYIGWLFWAGIGVLGDPASILAMELAIAPFTGAPNTESPNAKKTPERECLATKETPKGAQGDLALGSPFPLFVEKEAPKKEMPGVSAAAPARLAKRQDPCGSMQTNPRYVDCRFDVMGRPSP